MNKPDLNHWRALGLKHWRQWRRVHGARTLSERRLLVAAGVALTWFLLDFVLVTPAYQQFKLVRQRMQVAELALRSHQAETARMAADMVAMEAQIKGELAQLRRRVDEQSRALDDAQAGMVPARQMRLVLEGLLSRNGQLRLKSMKTLSPEDVQKAGLAVVEVPGLYRHGLDVVVQGSFNDLLAWLRSVEQFPRRLLWSGMRLDTDEFGRVSLSVRLFTVSPDADPLEISAP